MAKQITVRGVGPELSKRLERMADAWGTSVNGAILRVLEDAVGLDAAARKARLSRYTTWSDEDLRDFARALEAQRVVDSKLWA